MYVIEYPEVYVRIGIDACRGASKLIYNLLFKSIHHPCDYFNEGNYDLCFVANQLNACYGVKEFDFFLEEIPFSEENYAAQIAYSWFLYCEGDFIAEQVSYDWKFYQRKWAEKIQLAINRYQDYPKISFIVAYSLEISGMDIDNYSDYEKISEKCYEFSRKTTQDRNFSRLIEV